MATFKAIVYKHHRKEDGTFNVKIRITHNRFKRHDATSRFVTKDDLTKGYKIKNQSLIDDLDVIIKNYRKACDELGERIKVVSPDLLPNCLENYKVKGDVFLKYGQASTEGSIMAKKRILVRVGFKCPGCYHW